MNKVLWSLCHATSQQFASLSPPLIDSHRIVNPIIRSSRSFKPCTYQPPQSTPFMVHPSDSQQHLTVYDPIPPHSRQPTGILGSIWAPQPRPSDTTWPKALDTFSRVTDFSLTCIPETQ